MKKTKKIIISSIIGFAILLTLFSIFDLQISKTIADLKPGQYYTTNLFAIIFEVVAETVMFVICSCAGLIIFIYFLQNQLKQKWLNILTLIASAIFSVASMWYGIRKMLQNLNPHTNFGLNDFLQSMWGKASLIIISLAICGALFVLLSKIKKENIKKLFGWAIVAIIVCALSTIITQGAKYVIGRTRYRAMMYEGDTSFEHYSPWFAINNNKFASTSPYFADYFKSFPSGHVSMGATIILLTFLPMFVDIGKKWKVSFGVISAIFIILVVLSRLISGAHFASDVLMGAVITIAIAYLTLFVYKKIVGKKTN